MTYKTNPLAVIHFQLDAQKWHRRSVQIEVGFGRVYAQERAAYYSGLARHYLFKMIGGE